MLCKCGKEFHAKRPSQSWCSDSCRQRHRKRTEIRPFVGIDGEGIGNRYVLLAAGNGASIASKKGLTTEQCLDFLLNLDRGHKHGIRPLYVWFAFNYDINMILGDLPLKENPDEVGSIEELRRENETTWRGYLIRYFPGKFFQIIRGKRIHTSYDTWSFFGSTFTKELKDFQIECPDIIFQGKEARKDFDKWPLKKIADYNNEELIALEKLMEKLRVALQPLEIPMQSWHGPGAIAQGWLRKNKANHFIVKPEEEMEEGVNCAYFGGRIDARGYGFVNPVGHYDIVSAYPSAARFLPDLSLLSFSRFSGCPERSSLYLAKIRWEIEDEAPWGVFPWRSKNGTIRYPLSGEGWYWNTEIEAAIANYPWKFKSLDFIEGFQAEGRIEYPFRNLIEEAFAYRKELKERGDLSHIAIKLMLNSIYGKFAQTVGKPRFHCLIWAGLITAHTRGKLLEVVDENTVCVMTDSVWSFSENLNIQIGSNLGEWESQPEKDMVLAEAGLYSAIAPDGKESIWQRGFNKENPLDIRGIVRGWLNGEIEERAYDVTRFIGMGLASMTSYPWREWVTMRRAVKPVSLEGTTKRFPHFPHESDCDCQTSDFVTLPLRPADENTTSYPYLKEPIDLSLVILDLEDECEE